MTDTDNIAYLNRNTPDLLARRVLVKRLLPQFQRITQDHLKKIIQNMFENADDALFKIAENAETSNDKNLYMDSMRIVRLQRDNIEDVFNKKVDKGFEEFLHEDHEQQDGQTDSEIDYNSMELVSEEDLEITLAIERLIQKVHSLYQQDISAINKRMAHLFGQEEIDTASIPISPEYLVKAYSSAAEKIELELEVRIILLKLFDWQCITGLGSLYQAINNEFINADVLPVIKTTIRQSTPPGSSSHGGANPTVVQGQATSPGHVQHSLQGMPPGGLPADGNVWGRLQHLLGEYRTHQTGGGAYAGQHIPVAGNIQQGYTGAGSSGVVSITPDEMLSSLTNLQQDIEGAVPQGAHAVGNYIRVQLQSGDNKQRQLKPLDNDLIDVVCLIFEYILDDPQLPNSAKSSLARLQIPLLKVAMLDQDLFSSNGHPARRLLDQMARAAIGIDESADTDNPVLHRIHDITQQILDEFRDDISLFEELEQEFRKFMDDLSKQEQNTLSEIEVRQQEREELALARIWVRETLEQHLLGRELPGVVADIILGPWKDVMLQTYLQEGEDSTLWKTQIRFIDVLCWSVEPKQLKIDKSKLGNIIQQLIKTLKQGLQQIDYPEKEVEAIFEHLEPYHLASIRGRPQSNMSDQSLNDVSMQTNLNMLDEEYQKLQAEEAAARSNTETEDKVVLENIVLEGWDEDPVLDEIGDEYLQLARHLEMGKWVEFKQDNGKARRAKLAWKSSLLGEYTFLNWKFDVVADKTLQELADELRSGRARVVEDVPLMDRALSAVLTSLTPKASGQE